MTHARTTVFPAATPIQAAIAAHRAAYDAFQIAPEGRASEHASDAYSDASMVLVAAVCGTGPDALALFRHLMWWLREEAEFSEGHQPAYGIAMARVKDLSFYLGALVQHVTIPPAMPSGRLAARIPRRAVQMIDLRPRADDEDDAPTSLVGWEAVTPVRPDTAHVRALRVVELAGEALTAVAIIAGGVFAYGYLPLV
jgi:hypothetical protein